jgi:hypothetical protein
MSDQNRNPGSQRQQPQQGAGTGAGSRQHEQQTAGGSMQQDQGRPPTSSWMEQQGGVGHQQEQGRGGAHEMPDQAGGQMGQQSGGARQQGDVNFESEDDQDSEFQPEQRQGESRQGDDPDFRTNPGGMQHEAQGGAGAQPGATGMGTDTRGGGARHSRENRDRDRGDPENR